MLLHIRKIKWANIVFLFPAAKWWYPAGVSYPDTPLFAECREQELLRTVDWDRYDMREPVMETPLEDGKISKWTQGMVKGTLDSEFVGRKLLRLRSLEDVRFLFWAAKKGMGHLRDFAGRK